MRKKRVLIHSNFCKMFTGFGKHKKNLLSYLYNTGKYDLIELSNGYTWESEQLKFVPWKSYGMLPDDPEIHKEIAIDERRKNAAGYGAEMIDYAVKELKPDIYLGIEDVWAFNGFVEKEWWNKVHCIIHTTLDSLPILPDAVSIASKINHYFVWASFAEKAMHKLGHTHVKTVHGTLDTSSFFRFSDENRLKLRNKFQLSNEYIIGFVFRNQLRKSVPNLLDGFKLFYTANPHTNAKLLLHTSWNEGWDILKLLKEKEIDPKNILTTYVCKNCNAYHVKSFSTHILNCDYCRAQNSCETTNVKNGVTEQQLNEVYNLMDVYCHPFTSGGQEIPIQEAKLTELITLVTNYSCGEDCSTEASAGFPLEWAEYREPGTQFIKASTLPTSIFSQLQYVYNLPSEFKKLLGQSARQFVIDNYSIQVVGKFFEELFDSLPYVDYEFENKKTKCDPFYDPDSNLQDKEWIESLYSNILVKQDPAGVAHWTQRLKSDLKRSDVLNYFRKVALSENQSSFLDEMLLSLKENKSSKKIAFVQPNGAEEVIIATSLVSSIKKLYPEYDIYFFTKNEYFDLVNSHPDIKKVLNYFNKMDDPLFFEGKGANNKYFDMVFAPYLSINNNYFRNAEDIIQYNIYESN
jgi:glycosyltransferase involved in cell wall biosynthesis